MWDIKLDTVRVVFLRGYLLLITANLSQIMERSFSNSKRQPCGQIREGKCCL